LTGYSGTGLNGPLKSMMKIKAKGLYNEFKEGKRG
jgi:hypothetical protein